MEWRPIITTIAFDGKTIAADTQLTFGNIKSFCRKIYRFPEKEWVLSCAGDANAEGAVLEYLRGGEKPDDKVVKKFEAIVVDKNKNVYYMSESVIMHPLTAKIAAYGSGWQIAMAAMHMGLDAHMAVVTASELDIYTNSIVDIYDIETDTIRLRQHPDGR